MKNIDSPPPPLDLRAEIAARIEQLGLTQQQAADMCGIAQPNLQAIITRRRSANAATLSRMIQALGGEIRWRDKKRGQ